MSTFIDSNIFIAFANEKDRDHKKAVNLVDQLRKGDCGVAYTSDYIFDEAITTALVRTRRISIAISVGKLILGSKKDSIPSFIRIIKVNEKTFSKAWNTFKSGKFEGLSFTDHTILAQLKTYDIKTLMSLDTDFEGLVSRIH